MRALRVFSLVALMVPGILAAQNIRSAVSVNGSDLAPCTIVEPCRTFGVAISRTNSGGEIIALTSGGYGPFVIDRSISILVNAGVHAAIAPTSGIAISIFEGVPRVLISGLSLTSLGAQYGVFTGQGAAHLTDMFITGFATAGLYIDSTGEEVLVHDLTVRDCGIGIYVGDGIPDRNQAVLNDVRADGNSHGVVVASNTNVVLADSQLALNTINGILVLDGGIATIKRCNITLNLGNGINVEGTAFVSDSMITANTNGVIYTNGGDGMVSLLSNGTNVLDGNLGGEAFQFTFSLQ